MVDYYATLNIDRNADYKTIRKAYKKLAVQYHPDKNQENDTTEIFKEISEAYQVLSDVKLRQKYDSKQKINTSFINPYVIFKRFFKKIDPDLCNYIKEAAVLMGGTLLNDNKDINDVIDEITTKSFIDKTTDTMNKYLKKKIGNYEDTKIIFNYNITIEKLNEYYEDELAININYDFLRKYTHIAFTIENKCNKKTFLLDLIFTDFDIEFGDKVYKLNIYNNFSDNLSRKPNSSDIYLTIDIYIADYVKGFLFKYNISDSCKIEYNICLSDSNIIRVANLGVLTKNKNYGDLYIIFKPTNLFSVQLPINDIYDTLYSIEYI